MKICSGSDLDNIPASSCVPHFEMKPTDGIGVEEPAGRPCDALEHLVMEGDGGAHTEDKEADRPDHRGDTEAGHESAVDAEVEEVHLQRLFGLSVVGGDVARCHDYWRTIAGQDCILWFHILTRPVTQPYVRSREEGLAKSF